MALTDDHGDRAIVVTISRLLLGAGYGQFEQAGRFRTKFKVSERIRQEDGCEQDQIVYYLQPLVITIIKSPIIGYYPSLTYYRLTQYHTKNGLANAAIEACGCISMLLRSILNTIVSGG